MKIQITVNGTPRSGDVEDGTLLADWLRDGQGLTGTHMGCDTSQCGCCTVLVDGDAVKSCTMLAAQADGSAVTTIEGLSAASTDADAPLHPVQLAFAACHGLQCGFCTPGMIMATVDLLKRHPDPDDAQIREGLAGNLCRCTGYVNIAAAVKTAARLTRENQR